MTTEPINPFYFVFGICAFLLLMAGGVRVALYLSERKFRQGRRDG